MAVPNSTIIVKLESSELFYANLVYKNIQLSQTGIPEFTNEIRISYIYYLITSLRKRIERNIFDDITIELYNKLLEEIPYNDDNGEVDPDYIDIIKPYPINNGLVIIDNTFYPQVLSPSLNLSKLVKTKLPGGLFVLDFILDTYTGELFSFKQLDPLNGPYTADGVITILLNGNYYKRQYTGYANLLWWGAKPDGITDSTNAIQASWNTGLDVYAPGFGSGKEYRYTFLTIKDRTKFHGSGTSETILKVLPSNNPHSIIIDEGPVTHVKMSDLLILGLDNTANTDQNGFRAEARVTIGNPTGGLWWSTFERVFIFDFDGDAIQLIGNGNGFLPIQLNYFELCEFHAGTRATSRAMMQDGQIEQMQWTRCAWSGKDGTNPNDLGIMFQSTTRDLGSGGGSQTFTQCYVGNVLIGMETHFSINMKWLGTYFENCVNGVGDFYELSTGLWFDGSSFQACGVNNTHDGFLFRNDFSSSFFPGTSHLFTQPDYGIKGLNQGYHGTGEYYGFNELTSKFEGEYQDIEITIPTGETDLTQGRIKLIATRNGLNGITNTTLKWIDSPAGPGKEFLITSNFGFDIRSGGNIFTLAPLRVFVNDSIIVKRIDDFYHIIAYIPYKQDATTVDVIQFGAKGGTNDDTEAFQAAHDYVMLSGGGRVFIPFKAEGYSISNVICTPFCTFIGNNNVNINPITSAHTEVFTMTGIPVIQHSGYFITPNPSNPGQTVYNFSYTQPLGPTAPGSGIVNATYITDFTMQATSDTISTINALLVRHTNKIRIRIDGSGIFDDYIRFDTTGNILIPATYGNEIILRNGDVIELTVRDSIDHTKFEYLVTSVVRRDLRLASLPISGQWLLGERIYNSNPTIGSNEGWVCTQSGNYATTPPTWISFGTYSSSPIANVGVVREIPSGTVDGTNTIFTLAHNPVLDSESIYLNGLLQDDAGEDYTILGNTITFIVAPLVGDKIRVSYTY